MFVKIRTIDGKFEHCLETSKLMKIEEFKLKIAVQFSIKSTNIRLFYQGKQLENGYRICHYKLNHHDVVQLFIDIPKETKVVNESSKISTIRNDINECPVGVIDKNQSHNLIEGHSTLYRVGDAIDCIDRTHGAWFEATIQKIFINNNDNSLVYRVQWQFLLDDDPFDVDETMIRPRAKNHLDIKQIKLGQRIMINYNIENPDEVGYWYDFIVKKVKKTSRSIQLHGTVHIASNEIIIDYCKINSNNEIYEIEKPKPLSLRDVNNDQYDKANDIQRKIAISCKACHDSKHQKCRECGCCVCLKKNNPQLIILCDECDIAYHIGCLTPALDEVPEGDWYCPQCKTDINEVIKAGEKLRGTKKNIKMELKKGQKDWGRGMGCMGRVKECTMVPPNHRGEIPGIEVGMSWKYRLQVSEAGVHRPHVAGIHGRESDCAYSLVLSGGYEDDVDNGDEFIYTGSGGRDLSGNKRTAAQSSNQTLTKMNKALALNCDAIFNDIIGASADNWRDGIPVRVVRAAKLRKHLQSQKYAPQQGFRYDGIYKVVKYFPEKGKSGFIIWRYILRRDDKIPAPWTRDGKRRIESLGLQMIDYESPRTKGNNEKENIKKMKIGVKRTRTSNHIDQIKINVKKRKIIKYELEDDLLKLIESDDMNKKLWDECQLLCTQGKITFINNVADRFTCVCCQEIVWKPITTPCRHNICNFCLNRSFIANVYTCPMCRHPIKKSELIIINKSLSMILEKLFPGYGTERS